MIKIKALNDSSDASSDSSDSEYQVTREAEEDGLNKMYIKALQYATDGRNELAIKILLELKDELETDVPKVKDARLLQQLKYLTYKNLGLLQNNIDLLLDALEIDDTDTNLWITAGRKCKEKMNFMMAKHCFEHVYESNERNLIVIDNLIELYFVLNSVRNCARICLQALKLDPQYLKAIVLLNECLSVFPPLKKELSTEDLCFVVTSHGGELDIELMFDYIDEIIVPLNEVKTKRFQCSEDVSKNASNKRQCLRLVLDVTRTQSIEEIGQKIKDLYNEIQQNMLDLANPIELNIPFGSAGEETNAEVKNESCKSIGPMDTVDLLQATESIENQNNSKYTEQQQQGVTTKQTLYDAMDKRRSTRTKNTRGAKSREVEDDASVLDSILEIFPNALKNDDLFKVYSSSMEKESSNSASACSLDSQSKCESAKDSIVLRCIERLRQLVQIQNVTNIFQLIETFLAVVGSVTNVPIPNVFMQLYAIHRQHSPQLPNPLLYRIGQDISYDMLSACLTANEIKYNKEEAHFLTQILSQLSSAIEKDEYRQFVIRLLVLRGTKELNNDMLYYALDLCSESPKYGDNFFLQIEAKKQVAENADTDQINKCDLKQTKSFEIAASNQLIINAAYIETILEMQQMAPSDTIRNHSEVIKLHLTKCESDLSLSDKNNLCEAIVSAQLWQKGIELFENWSELNEDCLRAIYHCVHTGTRAHLSPKLALKVAKLAIEAKSIYPWLIIYWSFIAEGVDSDDENTSLLKLFSLGHQLLGKKGLCTGQKGEFLLAALKVFIKHEFDDETLKCFFCLFHFPPCKGQSASPQHPSSRIKLEWEHCELLYNYFVPIQMPEYDSLARQTGLTQDTKELFLSIYHLIPPNKQPSVERVHKYITQGDSLPENEEKSIESESITSTIYYLLADYHFKARDFDNAKCFYLLDLAINMNRFDSWAGLSLSYNYQLDQLINTNKVQTEEFSQTAFAVMRCFERAIQLQDTNSKLLIEYGLTSYNLYSVIARTTKLYKLFPTNQLQPEFFRKTQHEQMLDKALFCFERANELDAEQGNEELWLSFYMLGKVSEKKGDELLTTLKYYEWADLCLYFDKATYPKKISYYNPSYLALEALEIHYRIHACILKYLLNKKKFTPRLMSSLKVHLLRAANSPFVLGTKFSSSSFPSEKGNKKSVKGGSTENSTDNDQFQLDPQVVILMEDLLGVVQQKESMRGFQLVHQLRSELVLMCAKGLKRCIARYSGHYKSYYRLAHYHYSANNDLLTAKAVLAGSSYQNKNILELTFESDSVSGSSAKPNYVTGLFYDSKPNNLYNGIWRIPVDEIDRSGNFSGHMFRCSLLLVDICEKCDDYQTLCNIVYQLCKEPDLEKRYLNEWARVSLCRYAFDRCFLVLRKLLENFDHATNTRLVLEMQNIVQRFSKIFPEETQEECRKLETLLHEQQQQMYNVAAATAMAASSSSCKP